jgi:hypothetical protein
MGQIEVWLLPGRARANGSIHDDLPADTKDTHAKMARSVKKMLLIVSIGSV